jgi:hypothetical protein
MMEPGLNGVQQRILGDLDALRRRWVELLCQRSWRLRSNDATTTTNGPSLLERLEDRCQTLLESLDASLAGAQAEAQGGAPLLATGAAEYREVVQHLSFTAGWMAGEGLPISDGVVLVQTLQESLDLAAHDPATQARFFQGLMVVVTESYAASLDQRAHAHYRDAMEKSQLVCDLHPRLPFLFLVGDPDRQALEDAVGRVMMLAAMREAPAVVVDAAGLIWPDRVLPEAAGIIAEHAQAAGVVVTLAGVTPAVSKEIRGVVHSVHDALIDAVKAAADAVGLDLTL